MTNNVHLIVDFGDKPELLSLLMKRVAGRQTRYTSKIEKRTGSFCGKDVLSRALYLQRNTCQSAVGYIELNPMHAAMVTDPAEYQWSSSAAKVLGTRDPVIDFHPFCLSLGDDQQ
jgi:putative transposase